MNFEFEKAFVRDFPKIKNKELAISILGLIEQVREATSQNEIINLKNFQATNQLFEFELESIELG